MRTNYYKFFLSIVLCMVMAIGLAGRVKAADIGQDNENLIVSLINSTSAEEIFELMWDITYAYADSLITLDERDNILELVKERLETFGYQELSCEEIQSKNNSGTLNTSDNETRAVVPGNTSNVKFYSNRLIETVAGKKYEVQVIRAVPIGMREPLYRKVTASISKSFKDAIEAGALQTLKTTASAAAGSTKVGLVALSFYDIAKASWNALKKTTIVSNIEATYTYSVATQVVFRYVKKVGEGDSKQKLCHVSTTCTGKATVVVPKATSTSAGITPDDITRQSDFRITPNGYETNDIALNYYLGKTSKYKYYVNYINIIGLNGSAVAKIFIDTPEFPSQVQ